MNGEQFFSLIGDLDDTLVLAAARPPRRQNVISMWWLTAAAALVIGVIGYTGVMRATEQTPPVQPATPTTVNMPMWATTSVDGGTTTTVDCITSTTPVVSTTTNRATSTTPLVPTTYHWEETTTAPPTTPTNTDGTTTTPSTTVDPFAGTTIPVTQGTAPDGRPMLNDDYYVVTDRAYGATDFVYGFSFEELEVQSITQAPATLPVYVIGDEAYQQSLPVMLQTYAAMVGDTLTDDIYGDDHSASAPGERYYYYFNRGRTNYAQLRLNDPLPLTTPDNWLAEAMAYCPALFADMQQPTLFLANGSRGWNKEYTTSPATAQETVTFHARVYDAANDPDGVACWLNGVTLKIEDGKLTAFLVMFEENYHKVGDYPILSIEEATALAHKQCETLKEYPHYQIINEDYTILSTELVYMPHSGSGLRVPLYRFLVTANEGNYMSELRAETGLTPFYAVYVTAVPPSYWTPESTDRFITQK